jgi:tight adherence protein B
VLSLRTTAIKEYDSRAGLVVLALGAATCVVAYRLMIRLGRLPEEERVLR